MRMHLALITLLLAALGCALPTAGAQPTATLSLEDAFTQVARATRVALPTVPGSAANAPVDASPTLEKTLAAPSATPVPSQTVASSPTRPCYAAEFVKDVTIPDGTRFAPGKSFVKTWRFRNAGTCVWDDNVEIVFDTGQNMGASATQLTGRVPAGAEFDVSVAMEAPSREGTHRGYWRLRTRDGQFIPVYRGYKEKSVFVEIRVKDVFAVTSVKFAWTRVGGCNDGFYEVSATVEANGPGTVTYYWIRDNAPDKVGPHYTLTFSGAGTQRVRLDYDVNAASAWLDLYIDDPNHQRFGRAELRCP